MATYLYWVGIDGAGFCLEIDGYLGIDGPGFCLESDGCLYMVL
jgi:hypothetical protein